MNNPFLKVVYGIGCGCAVHAGGKEAAHATGALQRAGKIFAPDEQVGGGREGGVVVLDDFRDDIPAVVEIGVRPGRGRLANAAVEGVVGVGQHGNLAGEPAGSHETVFRVPFVTP